LPFSIFAHAGLKLDPPDLPVHVVGIIGVGHPCLAPYSF
jgi:hypothetical protein